MTWESQAMPPVIKNNFIYRVIWKNTRREKRGVVFLFIGGVGNGKSVAALRWLSDMDPNFGVERIAFSVKDALRLIKNGDSNGKLRPGSGILFDEIAGSERGADARNSLTETNKLLSYFVTISRSQRLIIIYCCPLLSQIDKRVRGIGVTGLCNFKRKIDLKAKESRPDFYWSYTSSLSGNAYTPRASINKNKNLMRCSIVHVGLPRVDQLRKDYEKAKDDFFARNVARWNRRLEAKDLKEGNLAIDFKSLVNEVNQDRDKYIADGKISDTLLRYYFSLGERAAKQLRLAVTMGLGKTQHKALNRIVKTPKITAT